MCSATTENGERPSRDIYSLIAEPRSALTDLARAALPDPVRLVLDKVEPELAAKPWPDLAATTSEGLDWAKPEAL